MNCIKKNIPKTILYFSSIFCLKTFLLILILFLWQGLFHAAIAQSGVAVAPWALAHEPRARAFELGRELGIDTNNTAELLGKYLIFDISETKKIIKFIIGLKTSKSKTT